METGNANNIIFIENISEFSTFYIGTQIISEHFGLDSNLIGKRTY